MALKIFVGALVAILMAGVGLGVYYSLAPSAAPAATPPMNPASISSVTFGTTTVQVEVASTEAAREQGLSDRTGLAQSSGMLFVFDSAGNYGFWMKDMEFSLDMIFIGTSGNVVTVDSNLSPATYHENPPQVFYPSAPTLYVLEVSAGFAAAHNVVVGSQAVFQ